MDGPSTFRASHKTLIVRNHGLMAFGIGQNTAGPFDASFSIMGYEIGDSRNDASA
jgi:hypothetical protein